MSTVSWLPALALVLGLIAAPLAEAQQAPAIAPDCSFDRKAMLDLGFNDFDQGAVIDASGERRVWGWRALAERPGCQGAVADLIGDYRLNRPFLTDFQLHFLAFHEGQVRIGIGEYEAAADLIRQGYFTGSSPEWTLYVDAILAFLACDRPGMQAKVAELAALPEPAYWQRAREDYRNKMGGDPQWPLNLRPARMLEACFDRGFSWLPVGCERPPPTEQRCPARAVK